MADETQDKTKQVYHTSFADFEEIQPRVYASESFDRKSLTVPAAVSNTGQEQKLRVDPDTVFITQKDSIGFKSLNDKVKIMASGGDPVSSLLNSMSLLANMTGFTMDSMPKYLQRSNATRPPQPTDVMAEILLDGATREGPFSFVTNSVRTGGFVSSGLDASDQISPGKTSGISLEDEVKGLAGVPSIDRINAPKAYIEAMASFATGHELEHLQQEHSGLLPDLDREITSDHATLRSYFNKDFHDFVMDIRSLGSLNTATRTSEADDHATQIWDEEYNSGVLPTKKQAEQIGEAPGKIDEKLTGFIRDMSEDDVSYDDIHKKLAESPEDRVAYLKVMRKGGSFDDIPFGNEFVDKYITAGERRYDPARIEKTTLDITNAAISATLYDQTEMTKDESSAAMNNPAFRYGAYSALRESAYADEIPGSAAAIDHVLADARKDNPGIADDPKALEAKATTAKAIADDIKAETEKSPPTVPQFQDPSPAAP